MKKRIKLMKDLKEILIGALEQSESIPNMVVLGGAASMVGVEQQIYGAVQQLDRMIGEAKRRNKG